MNHRDGGELKLQICNREITMSDVQGRDDSEGFSNLSRVGSTLEDAAVPSTLDCLFLVCSAPGAELAVVAGQAEAACLHQARKI